MGNVKRGETNGITLLPCPFCGGEASKRLFYGSRYGIYCDECSARVGGLYDTEAEASAAWNTRAEQTCQLTYKRGAMYDVAHYSCCGYEYPEPISEQAVAENYCPTCGAKVADA